MTRPEEIAEAVWRIGDGVIPLVCERRTLEPEEGGEPAEKRAPRF